MTTVHIQCDGCAHVYSIEGAIPVGGGIRLGQKVSTEIGCPKCLNPDGAITETPDYAPGYQPLPGLPKAHHIGTSTDGTQFKA